MLINEFWGNGQVLPRIPKLTTSPNSTQTPALPPAILLRGELHFHYYFSELA
jgi:hypothetical protein